MGTPEEVITQENIERVYGCDVWVDQNPSFGNAPDQSSEEGIS